jgi:hypothetical protein
MGSLEETYDYLPAAICSTQPGFRCERISLDTEEFRSGAVSACQLEHARFIKVMSLLNNFAYSVSSIRQDMSPSGAGKIVLDRSLDT